MHQITLSGQAKKVAATWDELSPAQLRRIVPILYGNYPDANQQRIELLAVLLGISLPLALRLTAVQLIQLFWLTDFVLLEPVTLTRQPMPSVRIRRPLSWRTFYAPADELANVTFLEFAFADTYFVVYANTREAQWLDQLVATLYRPQRARYRPHAADYGGDRRMDFNENLLEAHAARLAQLPEVTKLLIFTFYRGCRHALEQRYPHVFTPASEEKAAAHPDGWGFVLREMSGQAFGSYAETGRQLAADVLAKMNDDMALAERQERERRTANH